MDLYASALNTLFDDASDYSGKINVKRMNLESIRRRPYRRAL
jgi:hypothetical protein